MESWLPTINVGNFVGNHVGDFKNGEKDLAVMKITGIISHEGKDNVGVNFILAVMVAVILAVMPM
mgnify:FL=1